MTSPARPSVDMSQRRHQDAQRVSLRELLLLARREAQARVQEYITQQKPHSAKVLSSETGRVDHAFQRGATDREADVEKHFRNAYRLMHGDAQITYGFTPAQQERQWIELEAHIGWRHGHSQALDAVLYLVDHLAHQTTRRTGRDSDTMNLLNRWLDPNDSEVCTEYMLRNIGKRAPELFSWDELRAHNAASPGLAPDPSNDPDHLRINGYNRGHERGMRALVREIDDVIAGLHHSPLTSSSNLIRKLAEACRAKKAESEPFSRRSELASDERNKASGSERTVDEAHRAMGMMPVAWEQVLVGKSGRTIAEFIEPPDGVSLAEYLAHSFDDALARADELSEPGTTKQLSDGGFELSTPERAMG